MRLCDAVFRPRTTYSFRIMSSSAVLIPCVIAFWRHFTTNVMLTRCVGKSSESPKIQDSTLPVTILTPFSVRGVPSPVSGTNSILTTPCRSYRLPSCGGAFDAMDSVRRRNAFWPTGRAVHLTSPRSSAFPSTASATMSHSGRFPFHQRAAAPHDTDSPGGFPS